MVMVRPPPAPQGDGGSVLCRYGCLSGPLSGPPVAPPRAGGRGPAPVRPYSWPSKPIMLVGVIRSSTNCSFRSTSAAYVAPSAAPR